MEVGRAEAAKLEYGAPSWGEAGTRSRGVPKRKGWEAEAAVLVTLLRVLVMTAHTG